MLCCFSIPLGGDNVVLLYTVSVFKHPTEGGLSIRVALFGGFLVPLYRFLKIGGSKPPIFIGGAEPELRFRISLLRRSQQPRLSSWRITRKGHHGHHELGRSIALLGGLEKQTLSSRIVLGDQSTFSVNVSQPILVLRFARLRPR